MQADEWKLPLGLSTIGDVGRLQRELQKLDDFLHQSAIRTPGQPMQIPKTSHLFEEMVSENNLNMLSDQDRGNLEAFLTALREKAPVLHIGFNIDPSPLVIQRITTWVRQNIHHYALLQVGLNPGIGAGCVVRTTNKYFDFSLRHRFTQQRALLMEKIRGAERSSEVSQIAAVPSQPSQQPVQGWKAP